MTEQHPHDPSQERVVVAHTAATSGEAMVIRGLLESSGISSPGSGSTDPFPLRDLPEGTHGVEIYVLEPRLEEARRIIAEYAKGGKASAAEAEAETEA
jgi:hypothetical protein